MAKYQKERARILRAFFMELLGNCCARCGVTPDELSKKKRPRDRVLTFDCIIPCGDKHHRMDTSARMSFYRKQLREGNLQLLCAPCNTTKAHTEDREHYRKQQNINENPY